MRRRRVWSGLGVWFCSWLALAAALLCGEFGAPLWLLLPLLLWLTTAGLPTAATVLALTAVWQDWPLALFVGMALALSLAAQLGAHRLVRC